MRTSLSCLLVFLMIAAFVFAGDPDPIPKIIGLVVVVVVHEAGHAAVALWLGGTAMVGLNALGGHTITPEVGLFSRPRRALLVAAGPVLGLAVAALAWVLSQQSTPGTPTWGFLMWFVVVSIAINLLNLLPLPGLDGAHLLSLVLNDRGRPGRRPVVTFIAGATTLAALGGAWMLRSPVLALVVLVIAVPGLQAHRARPAARVQAVEHATLAKDADRLLQLAASEAAAPDLCGALLAAQARRDAAVLLAAAGRHDEARSLLVGSPDAVGRSQLVLDLLADERRGAESLARWVAERRGRSLPPAVLAAPDATRYLLAGVVGMGDHEGAVTWLLAARQAGGDVRPWAAHAAELATIRDDARVRPLATFP